MSDEIINPILFRQAGTVLESSSAPRAPEASAVDFQQVLSSLILSTSLSGSGTESTGLAGGDMMTPLLMTLIEQLLSQQIQAQPGAGNAAPSSLPGLAAAGYTSPVSSPRGEPVHGRLTQDYHPGHNGLDFGVVVGTPVQATMDGKVVHAGWNDQGYGNLVIVENGPYRTYYAHLSEIPVNLGQQIRAGSVVGLTGNTGRSTGPHLHYEVRLGGKPVDPTGFTLGQSL